MIYQDIRIIFNELHKDEIVKEYLKKFRKYHQNIYIHSVNVAYQALYICECLGYDYARCKEIAKGAILHDVGKLSIPKEILLKNGPLTKEEYQKVKEHTTAGKEMLSGKVSDVILNMVESHHERIDGSGYPNGRTAEELPEYIRIIMISDVYSAMTEQRSYTRRRTHEETIQEMLKFPCYEEKYINIIRNSICTFF